MALDGDTARALAVVINAIRPEWSVAAVIDHLYKARDMGPAEVVIDAAYRAAKTPSNLFPIIIEKPGKHWTEARAAYGLKAPPEVRGPVCQICGLEKYRCEERWASDHAFESKDDARRRRAPAGGREDIHNGALAS